MLSLFIFNDQRRFQHQLLRLKSYLCKWNVDVGSVLWSIEGLNCEGCEHFTPLASAYSLQKLSLRLVCQSMQLHHQMAQLAGTTMTLISDLDESNDKRWTSYFSRFIYTLQRSPYILVQMLNHVPAQQQYAISKLIFQVYYDTIA